MSCRHLVFANAQTPLSFLIK